jgi:hypothetical protein
MPPVSTSSSGFYNGRPYYIVNGDYVWWNSGDSLWYFTTSLGAGVNLSTIAGNPYYPSGVWTYNPVHLYYMIESTEGICPTPTPTPTLTMTPTPTHAV